MIEASEAAVLEAQISADLISRIGSGDRAAEVALVERYGRGLSLLLRRRTSDLALVEDLRQETFRIAIEKLRREPIEDPARLAAYLRGVAVNLVSSSWRKSRRQATTPSSDTLDEIAANDPGPFERVSAAQVQRAVRDLLEELPVERDREILIRLYLDEEDKETICAELGLDATHFNRVLFRAKQRFKGLLERRGRTRLRAVD